MSEVNQIKTKNVPMSQSEREEFARRPEFMNHPMFTSKTDEDYDFGQG